VVEIGSQTWMAENLKTTHYNDNTEIPLVLNDAAWSALTTPAYCWYNNDASTNKDLYGGLYNWYTVGTGKLCPIGWHVPSDNDWLTLTNYLRNNGYAYVGLGNYVGKSIAASAGWDVYGGDGSFIDQEVGYNQEINNNSGFTARPGGYRGFNGKGRLCEFWSSSKYPDFGPTWAMSFALCACGNEPHLLQMTMEYGFSVRCVKN
jgi:uncharacterized protein (TIGR02145 family)